MVYLESFVIQQPTESHVIRIETFVREMGHLSGDFGGVRRRCFHCCEYTDQQGIRDSFAQIPKNIAPSIFDLLKHLYS